MANKGQLKRHQRKPYYVNNFTYLIKICQNSLTSKTKEPKG